MMKHIFFCSTLFFTIVFAGTPAAIHDQIVTRAGLLSISGRIIPAYPEPYAMQTSWEWIDPFSEYIDIESDPIVLVNDTEKLYFIVEHTFFDTSFGTSYLIKYFDLPIVSWPKGVTSSNNMLYFLPPMSSQEWGEHLIQRDRLFNNIWFGTWGAYLPTLYLDIFEIPLDKPVELVMDKPLASLGKPLARVRLYLKSYLTKFNIFSKQERDVLMSDLLKKYQSISTIRTQIDNFASLKDEELSPEERDFWQKKLKELPQHVQKKFLNMRSSSVRARAASNKESYVSGLVGSMWGGAKAVASGAASFVGAFMPSSTPPAENPVGERVGFGSANASGTMPIEYHLPDEESLPPLTQVPPA